MYKVSMSKDIYDQIIKSRIQAQQLRKENAMLQNIVNTLVKTPIILNSRWKQPNYDPSKGPYNGYTVISITNINHITVKHPPQVLYQGDNGTVWSMPLTDWPGNLVPE